MRDTWLADIYQRVKKAHAERLSLAMSLLQKKAASDPEVAEILCLLQLSIPHKGQGDDPNGSAIREATHGGHATQPAIMNRNAFISVTHQKQN